MKLEKIKNLFLRNLKITLRLLFTSLMGVVFIAPVVNYWDLGLTSQDVFSISLEAVTLVLLARFIARAFVHLNRLSRMDNTNSNYALFTLISLGFMAVSVEYVRIGGDLNSKERISINRYLK